MIEGPPAEVARKVTEYLKNTARRDLIVVRQNPGDLSTMANVNIPAEERDWTPDQVEAHDKRRAVGSHVSGDWWAVCLLRCAVDGLVGAGCDVFAGLGASDGVLQHSGCGAWQCLRWLWDVSETRASGVFQPVTYKEKCRSPSASLGMTTLTWG